MRTIHKYPLPVTDIAIVATYQHWRPLSVGLQSFVSQGDGEHGMLCLWAEIDDAEERTTKRAFIVGTGNPLRQECRWDSVKFIGTVQMGPFVWHVYAEI